MKGRYLSRQDCALGIVQRGIQLAIEVWGTASFWETKKKTADESWSAYCLKKPKTDNGSRIFQMWAEMMPLTEPLQMRIWLFLMVQNLRKICIVIRIPQVRYCLISLMKISIMRWCCDVLENIIKIFWNSPACRGGIPCNVL